MANESQNQKTILLGSTSSQEQDTPPPPPPHHPPPHPPPSSPPSPPPSPPSQSSTPDDNDAADFNWNSIPPGFYFKPTDEELIDKYLKNKAIKLPLPPHKFHDVRVYDHTPEDLAGNYNSYRENEWFFFTPRTVERATGDGFWIRAYSKKELIKIRGHVAAEKTLFQYYRLGTSTTQLTQWCMLEYMLAGEYPKRKRDQSYDDDHEWVLCRMYK